MKHIPVCLTEILEHIPSASTCFLDCTFGSGGHSQALLEKFPNIQEIVGIDCDLEAVNFAEKEFEFYIKNKKLRLFHKNFFDIDCFLKPQLFDVILIDLGISSPQLDQPERGFSVYHNGPLDMRMNQEQTLKAADLINNASEKQLIDIFQRYGEIRSPYKVVRSIFRQRKQKSILSTEDLSSLIIQSVGWKQRGKHPATSYFRALRIVVNNELDHLEEALIALIKRLKTKGCLFVISFHSLEDRIVKWTFLKNLNLGRPLYKKVITPSRTEQKINPRSRSAKLRIFEKI